MTEEDPLAQKWRAVLDEAAFRTLLKAERKLAQEVLLELDSKAEAEGVRNPSAFVIKTVTNRREELAKAALCLDAGGSFERVPGVHSMERDELFATWRGSLDERAYAALDEAGPLVGKAILQELQTKGAGVRNPSAYVVKAVANALSGAQTPRGVRSVLGQESLCGGGGPGPSELSRSSAGPGGGGDLGGWRAMPDGMWSKGKGGVKGDFCGHHGWNSGGQWGKGGWGNGGCWDMGGWASGGWDDGGWGGKGCWCKGGWNDGGWGKGCWGKGMGCGMMDSSMGSSKGGPMYGSATTMEFERKLSQWRDRLEPTAVDMLMEVGPVHGEKILHLLSVKSGEVSNISGYVRQACKNAKRGLDGTSTMVAQKRQRM